MTGRPAGGARSKRWPKQDGEWFVEPRWVVEQLFDEVSFGPPDNRDIIYDPFCGKGTILDVAKSRGHPTIGGDIIDRGSKHPFNKGDFLTNQPIPAPQGGHSLSIVTNPAFSLAERAVRRAIECVQIRRAVFLVPIAFLCSEGRYQFFVKDCLPSHVFICSQRPTMPPGALIDQMASPFEGGMQDSLYLVYTYPHKWRTELRWLRPTVK